MNYRVRLNAILNNDEMIALKRNTEIRLGSSIDNLTVAELRDLSDYLPDRVPTETLIPKQRPALRALAIIISRAQNF